MCITKTDLKKYRHLKDEVEMLKEKYREILDESKLVKALDGMPHGTGITNPTEQQAMKLLKVSEDLMDTINRKIELYLRIEKELRKLSITEYSVMFRHYILCETWEVVAEKLHYSDRQVFRIHKNALRRLAIS